MNEIDDPRIPVTIVTGFLGAGKTTLLNHLLTSDHGQKIAVIVNEFGEIGIDHELIVGADDEIIEMNNGCICCTVRGDLVRIALQLLDRKFSMKGQAYNFDRIVIETTGLADPGPVIQTFLAEELLAQFFKMDAVVTLVDACHAHLHLNQGPEAQAQVAFADILLLNKSDLVTVEERTALEARLRHMNVSAPIYHTCQSTLDVRYVLDVNAFDLNHKLEIRPNLLHAHHHHHEDHVHSIILQDERPVQLQKINRFMDEWLVNHAEDTYRYKGIIHVDQVDRRVVFQGVHMMLGINTDRNWRDDEQRLTRIVIIGKNLDEAWFQQRFAECIVESTESTL
ncbi:CobW family GTP-binding protein [Paenibacillus hunanensis]|uniref:G3E family GTPase n=1 Tax=Paenibacillus hunanensis TaxID=539262 RepID=A0ABU1J2C8_9BACL|nr:GTP-binding protein [Paenibacillus hunanensis]MDR6245390.1 G3E family GTPase [Paenibacillus hunanensis]GGJ27264.1 cobalamin biosynthesis protein CobW [Paenibacillus hunanensis]